MNKRNLLGLMLSLWMLVACAPIAPAQEEAAAAATLVIASHDSFAISEALVTQFEAENNVTLQFLTLGDAGEALNKIILSKDAPLADLFFGVDNTFLSRALAADIFDPYAAPRLAEIPAALKLDPENRLLPVDVGYVNINADQQWFADQGIPLPQTLADLADPAYKDLLVVPNPATSSPGLAFLLATISTFGEEEYLDYWADLRANGVLVTSGWSEAYYDHFTVGSAGAGDRPLVVSYTSSPPADVVFASDGRTEPASVNVNPPGGVFQQIEFVGIIKGTQQPELAQKWIDFMLSQPFQAEMPLQMYVYPAVTDAELPELFVQFAEQPAEIAQIDADTIDANREAWIAAWTDVMLR